MPQQPQENIPTEQEEEFSWDETLAETQHTLHTLHLVRLREEAAAVQGRRDVFQKFHTSLATALLAQPEIQKAAANSELQKHIQQFSRSYVQLRSDALFQANRDPQHIDTAVRQLLKRFPQLSSLVNGALIVRAEEAQAAAQAKDYAQSIKKFKGKEEIFHETQLEERTQYLTEEYGRQLEATGMTPKNKNYSRTISAFQGATYDALKKATENSKNSNTPPREIRIDGLMQTVAKQIKKPQAAFTNTAQWYSEQSALRDSIKYEVTHLNYDHVVRGIAPLQQQQNRKSFFSPMRVVNNVLDFTADRAAKTAVRSAGARVTQAAVGTGARAAATAAAGVSWWVWLIVGAVVVIIGIIIFVVVINQASTVSQPYPAMVHEQNTQQPATPLVTTAATPLPPGIIAKGYGEPGQTWETLSPSYSSPTQLPVQGYFTWFGSTDLMNQVIANRTKFGQITPCPECVGNLSLMRCGDLDRRVWIKRANGDVLGPFRVVDCAAKGDVATIVNKKIGSERWIADLSWDTAHTTFGGKSETVVIYEKKPE